MPRKNRRDKVYDNSTHHVVQRGVNSSKILNGQQDYEKFKSFMGRYLKQYNVAIHNYCLMSTHIHFLIYVREYTHLSKFMHSLSLAYSSYFRFTYKYSGYLWQGRYKNILIEKDSYLLECARYIERNPLRANIVTDLSGYPWSSYNFYANNAKDNLIIPNPLYETLGRTPRQRRTNYKEYILTPRPYEKVLDGVFRI